MPSLRYPTPIILRLTAILCVGFAAQSHAQILLRFNLSDPSHAVVSPTSTPPNISTPVTTGFQLFLSGFFGSSGWQEADGFMGGNLTPTSPPASGFENSNRSYNYWSSSDGISLSLHNRDGGTITWTPDVAPFAGTGIMNLSSFNHYGTIHPATLPADGATGDIWGGENRVGSWIVDNTITPIPETSAGASLMGSLLATYLVFQRRLGKWDRSNSRKSQS